MTRKPYDGSTPVETLEEMRDDLEDAVSSLEDILDRFEHLGDFFNEEFRNNLGKAINYAQIASDALKDDIEAMEEE